MLLNSNIPDEYKYETDYRKIPREYLNPKIPQGRGNIKWRAFATFPEQYEILNEVMQSQNKIANPLLSDDALNQLDYIVNQKLQSNEPCTIEYWSNGYIKTYTGFILKFNVLEKSFSFFNTSNNKYYTLYREYINNIF
ncbi:YolD-like family protein [Staphylococcus lugdunensis]|uniref:YolD-like family protein n=1 Tax=Staphylococcus lugdunensis TaxID=28035 RepID=UPI001F4D0EA2|nr:YolD-like family protein [Staphylococcus lugdunensis]MCH8646630.1 YolD-like family protein [Staphylococcus lugdunensis]